MVRVETKIDAMTDVRATADKAKEDSHEALEKMKVANARIKDIEDNQRWLWRTVAGAIILAAVAFIIKGGLA
ncbi:hemolysin XhlA family protein [Cohnella lubricantis]|uniref:Hemolysin XhlA family protein n=2 Tax=Cohnella lubricantis TaxID=2163172 RepID=A0A841T9N8_9BACL|nr:hemolysin XhlA family protein [Cohnella lubricantis]